MKPPSLKEHPKEHPQEPRQLEQEEPRQLEQEEPRQLEQEEPRQLEQEEPRQLEQEEYSQLKPEQQEPRQLERQEPRQLDQEEPRQLKPEQLEAACTLDRHVSVTAGPGAGKTTVLVERYLNILRSEDVSVDQIVAITFTNHAANEMRERLRKELDKLLRDAPANERARWMRHKRTLDGAIITTIHGFCARLLREFPVEADVDPLFLLLDEHQSAMLIESVVEETLTEFITHGEQALTRLTAGVGRASLVDALIDVYRQIRNQGLTIAQVRQQTDGVHRVVDDYTRAFAELEEAVGRLMQGRNLSGAAAAKQRATRERWPQFRDLLSTPPGPEALATYCQAVEDFRELRPDARGRFGDLVRKLDELVWEKDFGGRLPRTCFDLFARQYALELIDALNRIEQRLDREKRRLSALDFDDLQVCALKLLESNPGVRRRLSRRYRFFLVDEFQDTNGLQRDLLKMLGLESRRPNVFIVGDRKQSIYGFRGADVDVFREMTNELVAAGGEEKLLHLNFRSQPPLTNFFNFVFDRIFARGALTDNEPLDELGYVEHESSIAERQQLDEAPLVELLVDVRSGDNQEQDSKEARERDAEQLAVRIASLAPRFQYRDVALLFRAMTGVSTYESALRRAGIPYLTVQGRGFYAREEISDLIQLLRFLDNTTDEIALTAVLRSPLCGISDEALFALRCAPLAEAARPSDGQRELLRLRRGVRNLLAALRNHHMIDSVNEDERDALDRAAGLLDELLRLRPRLGLAELLRLAVSRAEYQTVVAANFDGAQRLANIEKLFVLAERFERSGAHLVRDFVRFVHEFEEAGGRESEGQIDESADAVRVMTIHQAKGLEFPVVILPELHRHTEINRDWYALDRHRGLTLKVPDGRGGQVAGLTLKRFRERAFLRERFESARLLYVAATRARDRLILSGASKDLAGEGDQSWLGWIWQALEHQGRLETGLLDLCPNVRVQLTVNLLDHPQAAALLSREETLAVEQIASSTPPSGEFPLLAPVLVVRPAAIHRFSVTQLLNYRRCPRQYYFDRVVHAPTADEVAVWNSAEAPEPPANLTATLRGAVIHSFCERYSEGDDLDECLKASFEEVVRLREAELADRILEIDVGTALRELRPLAENYRSSAVRRRIESVRAAAAGEGPDRIVPSGVFSERRFRLRRPRAIVTGTIDKLLIYSDPSGEGLSAEIIDFKTNRFRSPSPNTTSASRTSGSAKSTLEQSSLDYGQLSFNFEGERAPTHTASQQTEIEAAARDYELQMQAYALAAHELMPQVSSVRVTLHFVDPNVEVSLPDERLTREACSNAVDRATEELIRSTMPEDFPVSPTHHCRSCGFLEICRPGRTWLSRQA